MPLLRIAGVTARFGAIVALSEVSFDVEAGEILGLIGPNGAGKTTLFNCISRLCALAQGDLIFDGRSLRDLRPHDIARAGIGRTFQHVALVDSSSVLDNVLAGTFVHGRGGFVADALRRQHTVTAERDARIHAIALLERLGLTAHAATPTGALTFAIRKRVELARALAARPKLILLDEPAGGLNHDEVDALGGVIRAIRDDLGVAILMVEHHLGFVMKISDRVVALDFGKTLAQGTPAAIAAHPEVIRAYLGAPA